MQFTWAAFRDFDASPWVAGGFLHVDRRLVSWFAAEFNEADAQAVGISFGTSSSQQVAEALSILFGMWGWIDKWIGHAPRLEVRLDSVTALSMVARMQTSSPHVALVARELALTLANACIRPRVIEHTPGVANKLADMLSRNPEPGGQFTVPHVLQRVPECVLPLRTVRYYRAVGGQG
jgi:hypothetical protein